ncbi:MAG TPA: hypothetical protein VEB66_18150 [Opitutaceae bacterium]|nr:hypothetical protein [Opitutaceae bacterium]
MATVSRGLPARPHLDIPKREARALLAGWRENRPDALERARARHPRLASTSPAAFKLADAQLVIAREYGFSSWPELKRRIESNPAAVAIQRAIHADDRPAALGLLRAHPDLLHVPLWSGNWGPPMSHAANLGRLELVQAIADLGARDHQHAFDRAVLQGRIECARWLFAQGARLEPGIIMGACETLNVEGFRFLLELGAPLTDERGDRLAPLRLVVETYGRKPAGKHAILAMLEARGYELPDSPIAALHRGDLPRLREHLRGDPGLLARRFPLPEIYPPELGCGERGRSGMHWTPVDGGTLLHLAVDFREHEITAWLLEAGADVNARAACDAEGFGGHTPLFHTVVNGPGDDDAVARRLLAHRASPGIRADLRKFLDWRAEPRWHVARDVTALDWARTFPDRGWVNAAALQLLETLPTPTSGGTSASAPED